MNLRHRYYQGHTEFPVEYMCDYKNCDKKERRLCSKHEEKHKHNLPRN